MTSQLHALNVPHDDSYLRPFRRFSQQRILAQIIIRLGGRASRTLSIRLVFVARLTLSRLTLCRGLALTLLLGLLLRVQRAEEALVLGMCG